MLFNFFTRSKQIQKLPVFTDIHNHLVPGVDDGSPDVETSMELLSHLHDWGITRIFASPHSTQDTFENTPQSLEEPARKFADAISRSDLGVEFNMHMEYRLDQFFMRQFESDNLVSMPGKFLLVENAFSNEPWGLEALLHNLRSKGFTPVLAHPERYKYYSISHRYRYDELHEYGLYFQVNLLSLAGHYGKLERETALYMLKHGLVQFIGTDLHRISHVRSIEEYLRSSNYRRDRKYLEMLQNDTI